MKAMSEKSILELRTGFSANALALKKYITNLSIDIDDVLELLSKDNTIPTTNTTIKLLNERLDGMATTLNAIGLNLTTARSTSETLEIKSKKKGKKI